LGSGIQWEYRLSDGRALWHENLADHCPSSPVIGFDKATLRRPNPTGVLTCLWQEGEVNGPFNALQIGDGILLLFIKICQNTPQLCWGDEWPTLSPGACLREAASAKAGERVG
jgi:hypothetical protein